MEDEVRVKSSARGHPGSLGVFEAETLHPWLRFFGAPKCLVAPLTQFTGYLYLWSGKTKLIPLRSNCTSQQAARLG